MTTSQAVIGLGFGDEGKGKTVSYLCNITPESLVVRFSGGQQAGHQVMLNNTHKHVFSNFGCGTMQGCHTYWSEFCTFDPVGVVNERNILTEKGFTPLLYVNENAPVTTPYEKVRNVARDQIAQHGTCGVGVGETWDREESFHSIKVRDLFYPKALEIKLNMLHKHCYPHLAPEADRFLDVCEKACKYIRPASEIPEGYSNYIFEGSQGLLLDQNIGFFPHVTRSNTGLKNIHKMLYTLPGTIIEELEVFLVTRAYQTRHGNGPMTNEDITHTIMQNPYEQNFDDGIQGEFRSTVLDLDLIQYAISSDRRIDPSKSTLVVTCLDLLKGFVLMHNGSRWAFSNSTDFIDYMKDALGVKMVLVGTSPMSKEFYIV